MPAKLSGNLRKLNAVRALFWMHFFSAVLVPFFVQWGGLKLSQVLLLNAWFMLWNFLLEAPTGAAADAFGRKPCLMAGHAVAAAAVLLYTLRPSFGMFLIAEVVFALAYCLHSGADEALAFDTLKSLGDAGAAKRTLARMESFKLGGILVAAPLGGLIAARWGLVAPLKAYLLPSAAGLAIAATLEEPPVHEAKERLPWRRVVSESARFLGSHRLLLLLTADLALVNALAWTLIWLYQAALMRLGVDVSWFGLVHAACCLAQIALLSRVETVERRLGSKRRFLVAGPVLAGAAFIVLGLSRNVALSLAAIVAAFTFGLTRGPVYGATLNHHIPSDRRATVLSFVSMARTAAIVLINPAAGWLADRSLPLALVVIGTALAAVPAFSRIEEGHLVG